MMPSLASIVCCALLFILLGVAWVMGYRFFKRLSPHLLVRFAFVFMAVRVTLVLAVVALYVFLVSDSLEESKAFAVMVLVMYGLSTMVAYLIKH